MNDQNSLSPLYHLDANRVNARQKDPSVNQLEAWRDEGIIFLEYSLVAYKEASYGDTRRAEKADEITWSESVDSIGVESDRKRQIENVIFPSGAHTMAQNNDVAIVYDAWWAGATLITADGNSKSQPRGILGSKNALAEIGISVISTSDAVLEIQTHIKDITKQDEI